MTAIFGRSSDLELIIGNPLSDFYKNSFLPYKNELLFLHSVFIHNVTHKLKRFLESERSKTDIFQVFRQE
ncbi:hypothetical protein LEP1GSC036_0140 [Leptospira weilii str. 2006001853]|uniref:Uncharacterized protein n=3 Tax=Leptospira weilii TaxID=28184 RepID=A0A828YY44_9LEPT|nr:hypothetical protein LEP1GSC036_0140 [Leptospira weilii str. 2006001853]EMJ65072.1 hypothetical protein LEP1GSC051_3075 [Leptospira sp. P2653]EMM72966.1 hypothetical protein LEP1GSC038_4642 [Leptospira weilii str. 2006001855]EMN45982.1 hypothetical protein LEP1GSC086_2262 [Leptospira weilii str. LNT 1234]EMY14741.1 hypothetical protein LEP1GSC043_1280 [Leptospira weilii str. Ecochallenge]OMI17538.1 hypothetical protein BUQ74_09405 [Leptospira weilii serovar Heyan]QDK21464.1 hypothetical pr